MASQITIRGVPEALSIRLKALADSRGESLNSAVLHLLEDCVGMDSRREFLRRFATWTDEDRREFEESLRAQRQIDDRHWQ